MVDTAGDQTLKPVRSDDYGTKAVQELSAKKRKTIEDAIVKHAEFAGLDDDDCTTAHNARVANDSLMASLTSWLDLLLRVCKARQREYVSNGTFDSRATS